MRYWRSLWFLVPVGVLATAASVAGALLPEDAHWRAVVGLAVASAAGVPFVLGLVVLVVAFALAPGRCRRARLEARLERIERAQATAAAAAPQFQITGGVQTFNIGSSGPLRSFDTHSSGVEIVPPAGGTTLSEQEPAAEDDDEPQDRDPGGAP